MDWGKTKSILIITFLLLNILLGYQLFLKYDESDYKFWGQMSEKEIQELLTEHRIIMTANIPKDKPSMNFIRANVISSTGVLPFKAADYENITEDIIRLALADKVGNIDEFVLDKAASSPGDQYFHQEKSGFPIFGGQLIVELTNNKELSYQQDYFEVVGEGAELKIISAMNALKDAIDLRLIPDNSEIESLTLGYYGEGIRSLLYEIPPVWRVVYKADNIINVLHINAFTGENVLKLG
jgi:regulatory protein YycI of two-component signal transduction system YycFG